jgi:hypothetical protein
MASSSSLASVRLPRWWLPVLSGLVLAAGIVALLYALDVFGTEGTRSSAKASSVAKQTRTAPAPKTVPLAPEVRRVAVAWISTAVPRTNLERAWQLTAPELKQGLSLAQWKTGNIPIVPYPLDRLPKDAVASALYKVDWSRPRDASLEFVLGPVKGTKAQTFIIGLRRYGRGADARWLVYDWQPRAAPPIPLGG